MALVLKDRVQETTTTTGTGTVTLDGAVSGFQSFSAIGNGNTCYYAIVGGTEWEVGLGTYTSSGTTLSRDTILESSNGGSAVNFSAGTKNVFVTYPAEKSIYQNASGVANLTSTDVTTALGYTPVTNARTLTINGTAFDLTANRTWSVGTVTSITAGTGLSGGTITSSGTIAIDSTVATLTGAQTLTNKTISGASNTLSNIGNSSLTNSAITINGTSTSLGGSISVGTVTSVAALTLGTTGTDLSSSVANGTTTPVITLNVPTASATNRGVLSSVDWTTFNNKGTVTSVSGTSPVSVATGTTTPVISLSSGYGDTQNPYASKTANNFLAAPNGTAGVPTFRSIVAADIPTLNQNTTGTASNVTGTVAIANGGTGATTAPNARTNLGATTVGGNLFTLTNPSAVTFPRFNADNTVSTLNAADFRTAIGAGTGNGTVTSVSWTGGIVSVATGTTTPAFTIAGTSGGIPYFSSASTWTSSGVLAANALVIGGGAGLAPSTITTGTGVVTALGIDANGSGGFVTDTGTVTLTNKTISADNNTLSGIAASSFVLSNASGNIDGSAAQKVIPSGEVVGTTDTQTLSGKTLTNPIITGTILEDVFTITDAVGFAIDPTNGSIQLITLGANRTPTQANWGEGEAITLMVNDGTAYTITWTTLGVVWVGGTAPTLATTGYTVIELWKVSTTIYGALVGSVA